MRTWLILGGLALALVVPNVLVLRKERVLALGQVMLLELAPVDPRSLIQGDYMRLRYTLTQRLGFNASREWPRDGALVVTLDDHQVARYVRRHGGEPLGPGEHLLRYRRRGRLVRVGPDAFYFQEGHAGRYARAKYGEFRVTGAGEAVLVGLRDVERQPLGPPAPAW